MSSVMLSLALLAAPQVDKKGATWLEKWAEASALAMKEGKPIVIDAGREA